MCSYEQQDGYDPTRFQIEQCYQGTHVLTPAEFMHGCVKSVVGMIRGIEPVSGI